MMNVVLLKSRARNCGGLEKAASRIAEAFLEKGAKVTILTTEAGSCIGPRDRPISIYSVRTASWPPFLRIEQFDRFVKEWLVKNPADLIFGMDRNRMQTHIRAGNGVHDAYLKSRLLTEGRLKYISCLMNPLHRKILKIEKEAFENPLLQKLFTNSHMVKQQILERFSTDPAKIQVVHNGVEWKEMQIDFERSFIDRATLCRARGLDPDSFHLLFIGNGYLRKGLHQLLEGLAKLKRKDLHLSVIGKDSHQELYEAKAVRLGLAKQVHFFGPQKEIRPFYQLADALAIPSFYDPFANVTVEALAMGLFILSSKYNGGSEVLHCNTGTCVEELQSVESMAQALEKTLSHPKTKNSALERRLSIEHLDYGRQMNALVEACFA